LGLAEGGSLVGSSAKAMVIRAISIADLSACKMKELGENDEGCDPIKEKSKKDSIL
jgi:hypothetical protein